MFFALGLMSKPMLVTLPFVLLLLDFWPLGRLRSAGDLRHLVIEKVPLFVLSGISSDVTILAQKSGGAIQTAEAIPLDARLFNAIVAYAKYVWMMFYPAGLAVWYPYDKQLPAWQIAASLLFLALVTAAVWLLRSSKPYLLFGWLWFLGTLVPVIGLVQVGEQQMADRYTYVPYFGLFVMIVWGIGDVSKKLGISGRAVLVPAIAVVLVLTFLAHRQAAFWKDEETLYRQSLSVTKDAFLPMHNLCHSLMLRDRLDEAEPLCLESVRIRPEWRESHNTLGIIRTKQARYSEAVGFFEKSLAISPGDAIVYANLAVALSLDGNPERAEESLKNVRQEALTPDNWSSAFDTLGSAYLAKGNFEKALEFLARALQATGFTITSIRDVTPIPHNGCRPPKKRRV